jgi:hypothetical protein
MNIQDKNNNFNNQKHPLVKIMLGIIILLLLIIITGGGYYFLSSKTRFSVKNVKKQIDFQPEQNDINTAEISQSNSASGKKIFAKFNYHKSDYHPSLPDYKISLDKLANLNAFLGINKDKSQQQEQYAPLTLSIEQKENLVKDNFIVVANEDKFFNDNPFEVSGRTDDWTDLYETIGGVCDKHYRRPENAVFVSSDFALHIYHRLLDKEFKYIEQKEFYPQLKKMTDELFTASVNEYNGATAENKKESYQRLIAFFGVPKIILDSSAEFYEKGTIADDQSDSQEKMLVSLQALQSQIPEKSFQIIKTELERIMKGKGLQASSLFSPYYLAKEVDIKEDYSQFVPRSHYQENPVLRSYFRSMMWYGRSNFITVSPELTRDAINITLLMKDKQLLDNWENIYIPTAFFVGESDDLGIYEYQESLMKNQKNSDWDTIVAEVQKDVLKLKKPQIMSTAVSGGNIFEMSKKELQDKTQGFHFMGQRFTPDAFIFSSLTQGDEAPDSITGEKLPSMPTGLMVMSLLENQTADKYLQQWTSINAPQSQKVIPLKMQELKKYFDQLTSKQWTQNIYWGWLYTIKSLAQENLDEAGYPQFMQSDKWNDKNLLTSFGSWTELKHDTLLYAKQSYAEMGGGGDEIKDIPPVVKGYVEPNIEFWDRIIPLAQMTMDGLSQRKLLGQEFIGRNKKMIDDFKFFRKIAIQELNNEQISGDDFEMLRNMPGNMDSIVRPLPSEERVEKNARSALIADVHTDAVNSEILYEADGIPNYIYIAVQDNNGTRLTKGLIYSYYEFKAPLDGRLTDADWQGWIYGQEKGKIPSMPKWEEALLPKNR